MSAASFATVAREMRHYLDNRLEQFSNGRGYASDNKTNGYHAAKVPDWQLRRWLATLEADAAPELLEALEGLLETEKPLKPDFSKSRMDNAVSHGERRMAALERARAAIAKATGAA